MRSLGLFSCEFLAHSKDRANEMNVEFRLTKKMEKVWLAVGEEGGLLFSNVSFESKHNGEQGEATGHRGSTREIGLKHVSQIGIVQDW